ncbi:MAG: hypothetical protein GEV08_21035, partial [Acidimicrobiia bacterium]|nr:hypothetical protein [Acidimicrobiia bacterium]
MPRQSWTERARPGRRLVAIAAVLALLFYVAGATLAWGKYRNSLAAERNELVTQARSGASEASRFLTDRARLLDALASDTSFRRGDLAAIAADLASLPTEEIAFRGGVVWSDPEGDVVTAAGPLPPGSPAAAAERPWLRQVLERGEPVVAVVEEDPAFSGEAIVLAVPTVAPGEGRGVLAGGLGLDWLRELVDGLPMDGERATVVEGAT